jgi:HK97 family phage portal protein
MNIFNRNKNTKVEESTIRTELKEDVIFSGSNNTSISALFPSELSRVFDNSAVWAAVRYLSQTISTLPIHIYEKDEDRRTENYSHPVSKLLENPNPYMTKSVFFETMIINLELFGISYAEITKSSNGFPISLYPITPKDIQVSVSNGNLIYKYLPNGTELSTENLLIIMGGSITGFIPLRPIQYMNGTLELSKAGEDLQKKYLQKGTMAGGIINVPDSYNNEDKLRIKTNFDNSLSGTGNAFKTVVLSGGVSYEPLKFSAEDQQMIQTREFSIQEVARRFGVSPYVLGDLSHATFSNVEQQALQEMRTTLLPRIVKIEEALNNKLFKAKEKGKYSIKYNMDGFLRGDTATRYAAYGEALQNGWMNINEVRRKENLNPTEDGDTFFVPLNYVSRKTATNYIPNTYVSVNEEVKEEIREPIIEEEIIEKVEKPIKEELLTESYFIEERKTISTTAKKKIERLTAKMLKKELALIEENISVIESQGVSSFQELVNSAVGKISLEYTEDFQIIFNEIASSINKSLMKQLGKNTLADEEDLKSFIEKYTASFIHRHTGEIIHQIIKTAEKTTPTTAIEDFQETSENLKMNLPRDTAEEESVRSSNALIKAASISYGITKLKAVVAPDACDFCQQFNGKVFGVEGYLAAKGSEVEDGDGNKTYIKKDYSHFPLHKGCQCFISPSL